MQSDSQQWRDTFEQRLAPLLDRHNTKIYLDDRNEFYLDVLAAQGLTAPGKHLVDLGAGLSVFGPLCRAAGMDVTLVDDFGGGGGVEYGNSRSHIPLLDAFEKELGVKVCQENFLEAPLPLESSSVDVVTCFHSLEHWHHSPKRLFAEIVRVLKPGGYIFIATPNAVNIRKRVYVVLGKTNFPLLRDWYDAGDPEYRGHVREPTVSDLQRLLAWNGFKIIGTYGRNFIGRESKALTLLPKPLVRAAAIGSDYLLRMVPTLCSDIHVLGQKPG